MSEHVCGQRGYSPGYPHFDPICPACAAASVPPSAEAAPTTNPFTLERANELLELLDEMAASIRADRDMGVGPQSTAYSLVTRFGDRLFDFLPEPQLEAWQKDALVKHHRESVHREAAKMFAASTLRAPTREGSDTPLDELEAIFGSRPRHECAGWDCATCHERDNELRDLINRMINAPLDQSEK